MMEKTEKKEQKSQTRKPFRKPRLRVYGDIGAITRSAPPPRPRVDSATHNPNKSG
jgi:hypothetical protein